jgi:hypothetical protein
MVLIISLINLYFTQDFSSNVSDILYMILHLIEYLHQEIIRDLNSMSLPFIIF